MAAPEWARKYEPPTDDEFKTSDGHAVHDGFHR
jgi:hypothetical protein